MNLYLLTIVALLLFAVAATGLVREVARADNELLREAMQQIQFEAERDGVTWGRVLAFFIAAVIAAIFFMGVRT
ncbi:hypothetical protein LMG31506_03033 [Cupriavidus yeoncheonensis]|uniref:Uncharacterized protein n=1 Tax=Cupriavidus yeoncheonensis TaxID=1462994 RepID=A0A916IVW5_9BURK|nr:hypothetical protein [Cupriavidus yeoncheonensis]CAG2144561.1 hypothetical protein LMG31506_03033 [Cupriavidus yeoncheonensis]